MFHHKESLTANKVRKKSHQEKSLSTPTFLFLLNINFITMSCVHELAKLLEQKPEKTSGKTVSLCRSNTELDDFQLYDKFYNLPPIDPILQEKKPWKQDVNYFKKTYISSLALMKMCIHAQLGGSIEVMGMLIGKIVNTNIIVMDVYRLPVEGTETRVNAQNEAYEYMVRYLQNNQNLGNRDENIVGWYHSHPGYGCWLSGIDVSTQSLNQGFQDPYLAIVVDPVRTLKSGKVDIGAFRTYPDNYKPTKEGNNGSKKLGIYQNLKEKILVVIQINIIVWILKFSLVLWMIKF